MKCSGRLHKIIERLLRKLHLSVCGQYVVAVWCSYVLLLSLFHSMAAVPGYVLPCYWVSILTSATVLTLPALWSGPRWRWIYWLVMGFLSVFIYVNIQHFRNFATLAPFSSVYLANNVDPLVMESVWESSRGFDILLLLPFFGMLCLWFLYLRKRLKGQRLSRRAAWRLTLFSALFWLAGQFVMLVAYNFYKPVPTAERQMSSMMTADINSKFRGKTLSNFEYLYYNGLESYFIWSIGDFFPELELSADDRQQIKRFDEKQKQLRRTHPIRLKRETTPAAAKRNLLIIMVESFENWPIEYGVNGRPWLDYMLSLTREHGSLYFPHLMSQISLGNSSDGHLMTLTGMLPLRNSATVDQFARNRFPSVVKAFKKHYGGNTYEIISDEPAIWWQNVTYKSYGFEQFYSIGDVDPARKSTWTTVDGYWCDFMCRKLGSLPEPFMCMGVTLSLHTPYVSYVPGYPEIDRLNVDMRIKHYLKICKQDEQYIARIIETLKQRGIYDNTTIVITGDHKAYCLLRQYRPMPIDRQEWYIPLIILNSGYETYRSDAVAGQIDIYPTIMDVMGLQDYGWQGVGTSLLRHLPQGAVGKNREVVGTPTAEDHARLAEAWEVSGLLIRSNSLNVK